MRAVETPDQGKVMMRGLRALALLCLGLVLAPAFATAADAPATKPAAGAEHTQTLYSFALYHDAKYKRGFKHFDYVNPDAPKGGTVHFSALGSYDTFNPFAITGVAAINLGNMFLTYDALMRPSAEQAAVDYPLLAESITVPDDYSWVEYKLRKIARWHDGKPITPADVVFSYQTIKKNALPAWRQILPAISKVEVTGPRTVRFYFKEKNNRRLILNLDTLPIIPKHYWEGKDFTAPLITPPLTSGPYKVTSYDLGRSFTLTRVRDYWGKDLPVSVGQFNYDKMVFDYYRDSTVTFEAFKAGSVDTRLETSVKNWATAYVWPAVKKGQVKRIRLKANNAAVYSGFFYNTRRPLFRDPVLREALAYGFDFKWMNKNLFYGMFVRTKSYFGSSNLGQSGLPSKAELKLLDPLKGKVPPRVFTQEFRPPDTDGTQDGLRKSLGKAMQMLQGAGYTVQNGKLISPITHKPVEFTILLSDPSFQPVANHWAENLKLIGVTVHLRTVDVTQYVSLMQKFDYDVMVGLIPFRSAPGSEIRNIWGSSSVNVPSGFNWAGIHNPAVDALINDVIKAQTRPEVLAATHALDRVLLWNWYSVPAYSQGGILNVAYWNRFGRPETSTLTGFPWQTQWWIDPQKDAALKAARGTSN
jgi:microcin C transport system substrate-binding protein